MAETEGQPELRQGEGSGVEKRDRVDPIAQVRDFDALYRQGSVLLHQGKAAAAVPYLEKAHQLRSNDIDAGINLAAAYVLNKKFRKAVSILAPLSEEFPDHAMIWTNLGAAYLGNPILANDQAQRQAIAAFEKALAADPEAPSVAYNIGLIYRDRGEMEMAAEWFEKALQHNPQDTHARNLLVRLRTADEEE